MALGNSGGILCLWDPLMFRKDQHIISDNFVVLYGTWVPNNTKLLIVSVYAPQSATDKRLLWSYITGLLSRWNGEVLVTGDFNEVRFERERLGSVFNVHGANEFNSFISNAGLVEIQLEGYSFTWSHPSAAKMSKLDRFLVSEGFLSLFPHISALCLDKNLSDHRPILLREMVTDYGATPFRLYHSWFSFHGFDDMVRTAWNSFVLEILNGLWSGFKKKLQYQGGVSDEILLSRMELTKQMQDIKSTAVRDQMQKGVMVDGEWVDEPNRVKEEFRSHFANRFKTTGSESVVAVWSCGKNKSPGPDGFTFEFFRKYWDSIGPDMCVAVEWFFRHNSFAKGCNASFITLIPKSQDPKTVSDFRPISLIGSLYKVVTKILAIRLSSVISDLISDVQTAFLPNRQILDGPFIINELLSWCRHKKQQAMVFKVDFAKAYGTQFVDYRMTFFFSFGFGIKWRSWIKGSLISGLWICFVNEKSTSKCQISLWSKQGILWLRTLLSCYGSSSICRFLELSRLVYSLVLKLILLSRFLIFFMPDDAVFIGEWTDSNLRSIIQMLHCFSLASGLKINLQKSNLLGVGVTDSLVNEAAASIGCSVMKAPFKYLGVMVGGGRLTLLKAVLGSTPIYPMSLYKVPKTVLHEMESLRRNFFNGVQGVDRKISWVNVGRKWVWRFLSHDNSLWFRFISAMHGFLSRYALLSIVRLVMFLAKESSVAVKMQGQIDSSFRRHVRGWCGKSSRLENIRNLVRSKEDTSHLFFSCDVALAISRLICRWWNVSWSPVDSYSGTVLKMPPPDPNNIYIQPPSDDEDPETKMITISKMVATRNHQPWRDILSVLNRCLTGKDFKLGHIERSTRPLKMSKLLYTRFTKLIIDYILSHDKSIPRRSDSKLHSSQDDHPITKLLNITNGDYKFGMEDPDAMISDVIKKKAEFILLMARQ
ncbi:RNA-directed DNA polymerase, eukaryota [Tanacetum coccineum]|uniref:RNA-directed DNA polymerase, eukaryota n=1 Tax=Tanacetum coccineum TaxID=301880 RepID=A0ABQ5B6L9_9ASTR